MTTVFFIDLIFPDYFYSWGFLFQINVVDLQFKRYSRDYTAHLMYERRVKY